MKYKILYLLLTSLLISGCSNNQEEISQIQEPQELKVAIVDWIGFSPLYVAQELGYYNDLNLNLDIQVISDIAAVKSAITSNKIDLTWGTGDVLLTFADSGINTKAFYAVDWSNGGDGVIVSDKFQDWSDFEGAEFVGQEGFPPSNLFLYALTQNGVDVSKVNFTEMDTAAAATAFQSGQVEIAALYQPFLSQAAEREDSKIFVTSKDYPYVITDYFSALPETLDNKKEAIQAFVDATNKAINFMKDNQQEAAEIAAPYFGLSTEEALEIFLDVEFPDLEDNKDIFKDSNISKTFSTFQEAMTKAGVIQNEVDIQSLYTDDFIR